MANGLGGMELEGFGEGEGSSNSRAKASSNRSPRANSKASLRGPILSIASIRTR